MQLYGDVQAIPGGSVSDRDAYPSPPEMKFRGMLPLLQGTHTSVELNRAISIFCCPKTPFIPLRLPRPIKRGLGHGRPHRCTSLTHTHSFFIHSTVWASPSSREVLGSQPRSFRARLMSAQVAFTSAL